jgi:hypothetical protein
MATELIGAGETYTDLIDWEANLPGSGSTPEVAQVKNEEITHSAQFVFNDGGTYTVTIEAASGAKMTDGGTYGNGARVTYDGSGYTTQNVITVGSHTSFIVQDVQWQLTQTGSAAGGANNFSVDGSVTFDQCFFENEEGGFVFGQNNGTQTIKRCACFARHATAGTEGFRASGTTMVIEDCTLVQDSAEGAAGTGIEESYATVTVTNWCGGWGRRGQQRGQRHERPRHLHAGQHHVCRVRRCRRGGRLRPEPRRERCARRQRRSGQRNRHRGRKQHGHDWGAGNCRGGDS